MSIFRDLRVGIRMLAKAPASSLVAIVLLAVGMAATPAVFSFANALFWKPLDAPEAKRVVRIFVQERSVIRGEFSYREFRELRDRARSFDAMAAEYATAPLNVVADGESREHNGAVVTANYFTMVGVTPIRGRFFVPEEDSVPDRDPVVVISARLWQSRFGAEPSTVGREITINGVAFRVIGIAPANFYGDQAGVVASELWMPTAMIRVGYRWCDGYADIQCSPLQLLARLAPGQTAAGAQTEVNTIASAAHLPSAAGVQHLVVLPAAGVRPHQQGQMMPQMRLLMAIALMLLLIACANVAGLLLASGVKRRREIAVRLALGASPMRIVSQLLTENVVLAIVGGTLGTILGLWIRDAFVSLFTLQSEGGSTYYDLRTDWRMTLFSAGAVLATGLLFGLLPAISAARCDMIEDLKSGGGAIGRPRSGRVRDLLAAAQVSLSLVLLVAAGLMVHSAQQIMNGAHFDPEHVVLLRLRPRLVRYTPAQAEAFYRAVAERAPSLSGVQHVGYGVGGSGLLWTAETGEGMSVSIPGQPDVAVRTLPVNPDFFSALSIPVLQGRVFQEQDRAESQRVLVVNQAAARRFWPSQSAVGQSLTLNGDSYRVVGVVADIGLHSLRESAEPQLYSAFWQSNPGVRGDVRMAVRMEGDAGAALARLHTAIASIDPRVPISEEMTLTDQVRSSYATVWLARSVTLWCGIVALLLSTVGLYSVLAFSVRSRTREIGVRLALGARPADVVSLVVRRGLVICAAGTAAGLLIAVSTWRLLASLLYGVGSFDLTAFVTGPAALAIIALAAAYLPARRAAQVDPMAALRCD